MEVAIVVLVLCTGHDMGNRSRTRFDAEKCRSCATMKQGKISHGIDVRGTIDGARLLGR